MSQKKILIVDDEVEICTIIAETLEDKGYRVQKAFNGVEGLKLFFSERADLIVLDLNMPRMDGYMFMEHLVDRLQKEGRVDQMPKILVTSAVDNKTDYGLADNLGAKKFMSKPIRPKELVATVKDLLAD